MRSLVVTFVVGVLVGWWGLGPLLTRWRRRRDVERPLTPSWLVENAYRDGHDRRQK